MESKTDYEMSDSRLIFLVGEENEDAKDFLYEKYSPMIHKEINRVKKMAYALGIEMADLSQEAMLAFSNAINNYKDKDDVKFLTFATLCVRRKLINYIEKHSTVKNMTLKDSVALDSNLYETDVTLLENLSDVEGKIPLNKLINDESLEEISMDIISKLSDNERIALKLSLSGMEAPDIGVVMGLSTKQVYNLLYRGRQKLKSDL